MHSHTHKKDELFLIFFAEQLLVNWFGDAKPTSILGIAEVAGHGSASTLGVDKVVCTVHLQQMKDRKWVTLKSWSTTSNSRTAAVGTKKYAVAHGYTYRVYVTLDAYKGNTHLETGEFSEVYGYFD